MSLKMTLLAAAFIAGGSLVAASTGFAADTPAAKPAPQGQGMMGGTSPAKQGAMGGNVNMMSGNGNMMDMMAAMTRMMNSCSSMMESAANQTPAALAKPPAHTPPG